MPRAKEHTSNALWYLTAVPNRSAAPLLTGMHTEFFSATSLEFDPKSPLKADRRPLRLAKNLHDLTVFPDGDR